jgi:hypothetical protein
MTNVIYNDELVVRLQTIRKTTEQFSKEDSTKSTEQLIAEIEIIKNLLDETKNHLIKKNNPIL